MKINADRIRNIESVARMVRFVKTAVSPCVVSRIQSNVVTFVAQWELCAEMPQPDPVVLSDKSYAEQHAVMFALLKEMLAVNMSVDPIVVQTVKNVAMDHVWIRAKIVRREMHKRVHVIRAGTMKSVAVASV